MVKCNIKQGKYCNEPFCHYVFHQNESQKWLGIWKNKLEAELLEYKKKEIIRERLTIESEKDTRKIKRTKPNNSKK
ncbi:MAG: hypothetical protein AABY22_05280 [Nanoarchaeota archaeon]|mgnify:CR=1 FL=1